ncbi:MAG: hypothetical protein JWP97_2302 [Labilithrix sp.]|nr:hypothetical protein [Labilithrix sp.]
MRPLRFVAAAALLASCANPVHDDQVAAQGGGSGDAIDGIPPGPTHRAGQQCSRCHSSEGPGPDFALAGTLYAVRGQPAPAVGAKILLTDSGGTQKSFTTNEVGNFYVPREQWDPEWPVYVTVTGTGPDGKQTSRDMLSRIGGNGGCAVCHYGADNQPSHMPPVFVADPLP